jgi:4-amino-4-deoxy-L-arabinose transferase-like glycosyltransferase
MAGNAGSNNMLHPAELNYAEQQLDWAVHVARLVSVIVSTLGTACVFLSARLLWPTEKSKGWAATLLYAFWPQFLFNGSMVSNDALVTALAPAVIYLALRLVIQGFRWRDCLLLGGLLAAALLTKLNALAFLPLVAVSLGLSLMRVKLKASTRWLALGTAGLFVAGALAVITSFRFVTEQVFRLRTIQKLFQSLGNVTMVFQVAPYSFRTFLASFGWGNLETYSWLYPLWAIVAAVALLGLVWGGLRRQPFSRRLTLALMGLQLLSVWGLALALAMANHTIHLTHGRYLLPALPAVCFLLISGWQTWLPRPWQPWAWKIVGVGILLLGLAIPVGTLMRVYAQPLPASAARLQALQPINAVLDNQIELIGSEPAIPAAPGQNLKLTLCWQALQPVKKNYTVILDIVGPDGQGYGELRTYPGRGNYATSFWRVQVPFCEAYKVPVGTGMPAPVVAKMLVQLWDEDAKQMLPLTQLGGQPIRGQSKPVAVLFKVKAAAGAAAASAHAVTYRFGSDLILLGYDVQPVPGTPRHVRVTLHWETVKDISANYVVFVHLRDTPTHLYAQDDSEPRGAWYPTPWWTVGETILDEHTLTLPVGAVPPLDLYIGVYNSAGGARLPVADAQGKPVVNDEVILAQNVTLP